MAWVLGGLQLAGAKVAAKRALQLALHGASLDRASSTRYSVCRYSAAKV